MTLVPFVHRLPTAHEVEKLRLILSTFQDGSGMLFVKNQGTLPGWRDFERSVALVFGGVAQESKAIFDVLIPDPNRPGVHYGISCKVRNLLRDVDRKGRVSVEVSNSLGKFWDALDRAGLNHQTYAQKPDRVGETILNLVESWYSPLSLANGGNTNLDGSFYLVLQWDRTSKRYQLYQFPLRFPNPGDISWEVTGRRLIGRDATGVLFEWYGLAGGQLKYYPLVDKAIWTSQRFQLEPLPLNDMGYGILRKVSEYFPELWSACLD